MTAHDPLTPEERELSRLLGGRLDKAPPVAVDAAVLAAARAAVQAPSGKREDADAVRVDAAEVARRQRRGSRWPAAFGIAASVVFAVGLAWQMRPEPAQPPVRGDAASAPASAPASPSDDVATGARAADAAAAAEVAQDASDAAERTRSVPTPAAAPRSMPAPAPAADAAQARRTPAPPAAAESAPAPPADPSAARVAPTPRRAMPAPSRPAVETPPSAAAMAETADAAGLQEKAAPARAMRSLQTAPAPAAAADMSQRKARVSLSADAVQAEVMADSQLTRRQWLQKIRHRRDDGDVDLARASLERYLLQYPESRLPRDLQPLLAD